MKTSTLRVVLAAVTAAAAPLAGAHDFTCTSTATLLHRDVNGNLVLNGDGVPVGTGIITPVLELHSYPADVGIQLGLTNVASEVSVVTGVTNTFISALSAPPPTFGTAIVPGLSLAVGGSAVEWFAIRVANRDECMRLFGGAVDGAPACTNAGEGRFAVTHDVGSTECRARVVCGESLVGPAPAPACPPTWHGVKQFGAGVADGVRSIALDQQCNVHVTGQSDFGSGPDYQNDVYLASFTASGNGAGWGSWGSPPAAGQAIATDVAGDRFLAWYAWDSAISSTRYHVTKFAPVAGVVWEEVFATSATVSAIAADGSGDAYVVGRDYVDGAFVTALGGDGRSRWTTGIGPTGVAGPFTTLTAVALDPAGNVVVAGYSGASFPGHPNAGFDDALVAKLDRDGHVLWVTLVATALTDQAWGVATDAAGNVFIGGHTYGTFPGAPAGVGGGDAFAAKLDPAGNLAWVRQFGTSDDDFGIGVAAQPDGQVWVVGFVERSQPTPSGGFLDGIVAKYASDGTLAFVKQFGTASADLLATIALDAGGDAFVGGWTMGDFGGGKVNRGADAFVAKFDPLGNLQ